VEDLVLGEEAGERRDAARGQAADHEAAEGERHRAAEAGHAVEVLAAGHGADDRAGGHEQQRLKKAWS
jgi:hypothetical protein